MIRLLAPYQFYKNNQIVSLGADWERYLVLAGAASTDLTGGIPYVAPVAPRRLVPASLVVGTTGAVLGIEGPGGTLIAVGSSNITAPGAPTGLTLTAAAGAVVAAFALPSNTGGSPLTGVTVTLSNGQSGSGLTSPITIASPAGTAVTATAKAANDFFESAASAASNSVTLIGTVTPVAATSVTLTGPTAASVGAASSAYTVALSPVGGTVASPVTVTPTAVTGVSFSPASLTLSTASPSGTFTATASTAGTKAIAVTSTGGLTAPSAINLVVAAAGTAPAVATAAGITGAPQQGTPLAITSATFTGNPAPSVTRVIKMDGTTVASGTQSTGYTPVLADVGKIPSVSDTASNGVGSSVTSTGAGAAVLAAAGAATWRNVANKVVNQGQIYPAYKEVGSTTVHQSFTDVASMKVVDSNWGTNAGQEPLSGADNIVSVAVEYPIGSTPQRFLFSGAVSGTNPSGFDLESDALTLAVVIPKNTPYKIHRKVINTAGIFLAGGLTTAEGDCCKFVAGGLADLTGQTGGYTGTSTGANFFSPPSAILALTTIPSISGVGDSRFAGVLDNTTDATKYPIGQIGRLMRPLYPYIQYGLSGETQTQFRVANMPRRIAFIIKYCTHIVVEHAINGFSTAAAAEVNVGAIWKIFADAGLKVYQTTTTPRTTGAWSATDGSDQVIGSNSDELIVWNTRLVTVMPAPLTGVINITPYVTLASDPRKWKAPGYTGDGLHETTLANLAIRDGAPITASTFV